MGDAVLTLFAREYILAREGKMDAAMQTRMTSNQFLSAFGEPTAVEASLGVIYREQGLEGAFAWIRSRLVPRFERLEERRMLQTSGGRVRKNPPAAST